MRDCMQCGGVFWHAFDDTCAKCQGKILTLDDRGRIVWRKP